MWQSTEPAFTDPQSWEHFIGEQPKSKPFFSNIIEVPSPNLTPIMNYQSPLMKLESQQDKENLKSHMQTLESEEPHSDLLFKRYHEENQQKNQDNSSEEKQPENISKRDQQKASLYSKNYREKKKEKIKKLEEQNQFLRKKVNELQVRLRQKQLELNRIKFSLTQDQWTIQQLNEEMMKKLTLINDVSIDKVQAQKTESEDHEKKIKDFLKFYEDHGFGGRKKKQVLDYYVNEFLQNVMRDREKYLIVNCVSKKYLREGMSAFHYEASEALLVITEESRQKNHKFQEYIRPACVDLTEACRELYRSYLKVLSKIDVIHDETKKLSMSNIEETLRRSRAAAWFQANQYRKQMRNLRAQWIQLVRKDGDLEMGDQNKKKHLPKKKKLTE